MTQLATRYAPATSKSVVTAERRGQAKPGDASDRTTPRFARHAPHVRAVLAEGGFPVLPDRPK
jgi:hypothetical protein